MSEERPTRKLAAIVAADVVGYSRLMGEDEAGTLSALKARRERLIEPKIAEHKGRIVKLMGDGLLAEFASVVEAVQCAVEIQERQVEENAAEPANRRIEFRVGINLGDVIVDGDDLYGDGVNVAARLEGLAEPGGICIAESVHTAIENKLSLRYDFMGEQQVKNITRPVRAYRVWRSASAAQTEHAAESRREVKATDKPSVAVLPFENMSTDEEQQFFADGITEDIITSLSKIGEMFVIARNSVFTYKNRATKVQEVAAELGVRYVVEGSVRRAGNRVRITAQLIDAQSGHHLWAERYDRELADIFDLQDEITQEIVTALQVELTEGEQARLRRRQTNDIGAWERYVRAQTLLRRFNKQDNLAARALLEEALRVDARFAAAWSLLGWTHLNDAKLGWTKSPERSLEEGAKLCEKSLALDDGQPDAHAFLGAIRLHQRRYDEAEAIGRRAIELGPNAADSFGFLAMTMNYTGRPAEAVGLIERAMRFSPFYPDWYLGMLGLSYRLLERYDEAIDIDLMRLERSPQNVFSNFRLAVVYEEIDRHADACTQVAELLRKNPDASLRQIRVSEPYQDERELERFLDALRRAGMPDESTVR